MLWYQCSIKSLVRARNKKEEGPFLSSESFFVATQTDRQALIKTTSSGSDNTPYKEVKTFFGNPLLWWRWKVHWSLNPLHLLKFKQHYMIDFPLLLVTLPILKKYYTVSRQSLIKGVRLSSFATGVPISLAGVIISPVSVCFNRVQTL